MSGGDYQIQILPLVKGHLKKFALETAELRGLEGQQRQSHLSYYQAGPFSEKSCFLVSFEAVGQEKVKNIKNWLISFSDSHSQYYPMSYTQKDLTEPRSGTSQPDFPAKGRTHKAGMHLPTWSDQGIFCGSPVLDWSLGFKVKVRPPHVQWPFPDEQEIAWVWPETEVLLPSPRTTKEEQTELPKAKKLKKKKKRYRDY